MFYGLQGISRRNYLRCKYSHNNGAKAVTAVIPSENFLDKVAETVTSYVKEVAHPESNSGVAINVYGKISSDALNLAFAAKKRYIDKETVLKTAGSTGIRLYQLRGDGTGVIGAYVASVLASTGYDGRILDIPSTRIRQIEDALFRVEEILNLGVDAVKTVDGEVLLPSETVYVKKLRLKLEGFKPVLYVARRGNRWESVIPE